MSRLAASMKIAQSVIRVRMGLGMSDKYEP